MGSKMTKPTKEEVVAFIQSNASFFKAPFKNQKEFQQFYVKNEQVDAITDYSMKLMSVLNDTIHEERTPESKGTYRAPAIVWWQKGEFEKVLGHPEIQKIIMDNKEHPALAAWQKVHPPIEVAIVPPQKTYPLMNDDAERMKKLIANFKDALDNTTKTLNAYVIEENKIQEVSPDAQRADNIINIKACLTTIRNQQNRLSALDGSFSSFGELESIQRVINTSIKSNLLNIEQPEYVKGFGERLLNAFAKLFGSEYKSQETKNAEKQESSLAEVSAVAQRMPDILKNSGMKMKKEMQDIKNDSRQPDENKEVSNLTKMNP